MTFRHVTVGSPPPLRGLTDWHLQRFAICCRASATVLALQGQQGHAQHLRSLAAAADYRAVRIAEREHPHQLQTAA